MRNRSSCRRHLAQSGNVTQIWAALLDERLENGVGPDLEDQDAVRHVLAGLPKQDLMPVPMYLYSPSKKFEHRCGQYATHGAACSRTANPSLRQWTKKCDEMRNEICVEGYICSFK